MKTQLNLSDNVCVAQPTQSNDSVRIVGHVCVYQQDKHGNVRVVAESDNTITQAGKQMIYQFLQSTSSQQVAQNINYIAVGTDNTQPSQSNTKLYNEIGRKQILSRYIGDTVAKFSVQFEMNEQNPPAGQAITEAGLFQNGTAQPDTGTLFARVLFQPAILKQEDEMLVVVWTVSIT